MSRFHLACAAVLALALDSAAGAATYQDLRQAEPAIDRAVGAMPSSGIQGTLHRISSELAQPRLEALAPGQADELSRSERDRLMSSLQRLQADLRAGLPSLDVRDRLVLAQVADIVAFRRLLELYEGAVILVPCPPDLGEWGRECHPPIELELDRIAELLENGIRDGFARWAEQNPGEPAPSVPPSPAGGMSAKTFGAWLDEVMGGPARATGVESIDD